MKTSRLIHLLLCAALVLVGCSPDTPASPPQEPVVTDGVLSFTVNSNWGGEYSLTVYDADTDQIVISNPSNHFGQTNVYRLSPGNYRIEADFGDETSYSKTFSIVAGQNVTLSTEHIQYEQIKVNASVMNGSEQVEAIDVYVTVNSDAFSVKAGENTVLQVRRAASYDIKATCTVDGKTYESGTKTEMDVSEPVKIVISIDEESQVTNPVLSVTVTCDDASVIGQKVMLNVGKGKYEVEVGSTIQITDLAEGRYDVSASLDHDGFTYSASGEAVLENDKTTSLKLSLVADKSTGSFEIDNEIAGNIDITLNVAKQLKAGDTLEASALYKTDGSYLPVWSLRTVDGTEYETIGTVSDSLSYELSGKAAGYYVLRFQLFGSYESGVYSGLAASQVALIQIVE